MFHQKTQVKVLISVRKGLNLSLSLGKNLKINISTKWIRDTGTLVHLSVVTQPTLNWYQWLVGTYLCRAEVAQLGNKLLKLIGTTSTQWGCTGPPSCLNAYKSLLSAYVALPWKFSFRLSLWVREKVGLFGCIQACKQHSTVVYCARQANTPHASTAITPHGNRASATRARMWCWRCSCAAAAAAQRQ